MRNSLIVFLVAMVASLCGIVLAEDAATKPAPAVPKVGAVVVLTGVQAEDAVTLDPINSYRLRGEYNVPKGKSLTIPAGTKFQCDKDSELSVNGTLLVQGTADKHVVLESPRHGAGMWKGLTLKDATKAEVEYADVFDAGKAVLVQKGKVKVTGCTLAGNSVGLCVEGTEISTVFDNCVVAANEGDGVVMNGVTKVTFNHCTIIGNGGWAINGTYYASPTIKDSVLVGNKGGGIWLRDYDCRVTMNGSVMFGNGKLDVRNEATPDWDCTKNYWGKKATAAMEAKGDNAILPNVQDGKVKQGRGKVRFQDFLKAPPAGVGSTIDNIRGKKITWAE